MTITYFLIATYQATEQKLIIARFIILFLQTGIIAAYPNILANLVHEKQKWCFGFVSVEMYFAFTKEQSPKKVSNMQRVPKESRWKNTDYR